MSIICPSCDTRHIIQKALKSKTLSTLSMEEDAFQARKSQQEEDVQPKSARKMFTLTTKDDLASFRFLCKDKTPDEIFEQLGIDVEYNEDGTKSISHYGWPFMAYSFKAAGIDEEKLLQGVTKIKGNCDLTGSDLKNLGDVEYIIGNLTIPIFGKLEDLSSVSYIGGNINCSAAEPEDTIKLLKKLNLNPQYFRGYVNPSDTLRTYGYGMYTKLPQNMQEALNKLQGQ